MLHAAKFKMSSLEDNKEHVKTTQILEEQGSKKHWAKGVGIIK